MSQAPAEKSLVDATLREILEGREFHAEKSQFERLVERVLELFDVQGWAAAGEVFFWVVLTVLGAGAAYFLARFLVAGRRAEARGRPAASTGPPVRARVAALRAEARAARDRGDYRTALERSLFALILGLGQRGELEYHDAWTNRELLRRGRPARRPLDLLSPLVTELEPKEFGRMAATEADLDRLEELCERHLGPLREVPA